MEAFCHAAPVRANLSTTGQEGNGSAQGDLLTDRELAREPAKGPPKRWRNWYRALSFRRGHCVVCGTRNLTNQPGDIFSGHCRTHPTKEVAEQRAIDQMAVWVFPAEYLGAYPEGERP